MGCSSDNAITALDISGLGLTGSITANWAVLAELTSLDISRNALSGAIAADLCAVPGLTIHAHRPGARVCSFSTCDGIVDGHVRRCQGVT